MAHCIFIKYEAMSFPLETLEMFNHVSLGTYIPILLDFTMDGDCTPKL